MQETVADALRDSPSVEHVAALAARGRWPGTRSSGPGELPPLEVEAEHPYLLAYTSGTTGRPKGALHVHGGFLVSIAREAAYQSDVRAGDRVLFATDMGWIMGPWTVVGAGALGANVVYMEGAPDWPDDRLWRLVEEERVTMLGVSPTLVRALIPKGEPEADLSSLRAITTTGEPWNAGPYDWLNEHVAGGGRIPIVNISGGTEVGACFLSVDADGADEAGLARVPRARLGDGRLRAGRHVAAGRGRRARLHAGVAGDDARHLARRRALSRDLLAPVPGCLDARRLGVGRRGRLLVPARPLRRHAQHRGQADRAGRARVGRAGAPAVAEAAAIGVPHEVKGETAWIYCALKPGAEADADAVRATVAAALGKAFAPERVLFVSALPKTRSAKIVRRAVRAKALGEDPGDLSTLENPRRARGDRSCLGARHRWRPRHRRRIARELAAAGWHVTVTGRTAEQVEAVAREIGGDAVVGDISKREDVERMVAAAGPIDLLVANAGIALWEDSWETDPDEWWHVFEVNMLGTYWTCRLALPGMIERGGGRIVITGSGASYLPGTTSTAYSASKAAVGRYGEVLASPGRPSTASRCS